MNQINSFVWDIPVSEQRDRRPDDEPLVPGARRSGRHRLLVGILGAEAALLWVAFGWQVYQLVTSAPASLPSALALIVINALVAVWVSVIAVHAGRGRSWVRGAALSWQLVQIAISIGAFQGVYARPDVGWALLIPSVVVIVLLLTPGTLRPDERGRAYPESE
jgi:threonine/homoserine/homoserine lactone efflux protein